MDLWDQRTAQYRNAARGAIVVAVVLVSAFLADEDRDPEGWIFVAALAVIAFIVAFSLVRRLRP